MCADFFVGLSVLGHDLSVSIARSDGTLVLVGEEERYSRVKGGQFVFLPSRLDEVLGEAGIARDDVAVVAPVGDPCSSLADDAGGVVYPPAARGAHIAAWLREYRKILAGAVFLDPIRHHRAHAASAYYPSGLPRSAVVTIDGHGDGECCTISVGQGDELRLIERQTAPHSIGYLYRAVATYLGLRGHEREGKLMALAAYGRPVLADELAALFFERVRYPACAASRVRSMPCRLDAWVGLLEERFGPARIPASPLTALHVDLAASAQQILGHYAMSVLRRAFECTAEDSCCAAGGAFVNSVMNGDLRREGPFSALFVPAWANDGGLSVGAVAAALAAGGVRLQSSDAYSGSTLDLSGVPDLARDWGLSCTSIGDAPARAASFIAAGRIIGWAQGRCEIGPRALGNRSILAHPAMPHMRHELNRRKGREPWRPFGASLLLDGGHAGTAHPLDSPFMNVTVFGLGDAFASTLHVDRSSRIHTLAPPDNPLFAELIREVGTRTGTAAVLNTSLNGPGQPIARTAAQCLQTFAELNLDALFIGDYLVTGRKRPFAVSEAAFDPPLPARYRLVVLDPEERSAVLSSLIRKASEVCFRPDLLAQRPIADPNDGTAGDVVIRNPWYNAVFIDMLPRVAAWALERIRNGTRVVLVDQRGEAVPFVDDSALQCDELCSRKRTDVEGHFLRHFERNHARSKSAGDR